MGLLRACGCGLQDDANVGVLNMGGAGRAVAMTSGGSAPTMTAESSAVADCLGCDAGVVAGRAAAAPPGERLPPAQVSGLVSRQKTGKSTWVRRFLSTQEYFLVSYSTQQPPPPAATGDDRGSAGGVALAPATVAPVVAVKAKVLNALDLRRTAEIALAPDADDAVRPGCAFQICTLPDPDGGEAHAAAAGGARHVMRAESAELARYFVDGLSRIRAHYLQLRIDEQNDDHRRRAGSGSGNGSGSGSGGGGGGDPAPTGAA